MALIVEGSILLVIGLFLFLIGNETIKLPPGDNEQLVQYAPVGGALAIIVGLVFIARGLFL